MKKYKLFLSLVLSALIVRATPIAACEGAIPYLNGSHSEITTVETVDYQEGTGTYYFVTKGMVEFWVLEIKQEPYSKQRLEYYTNLYKGKRIQIDFTVEKGSISTIKYHLIPATPVMQTKGNMK